MEVLIRHVVGTIFLGKNKKNSMHIKDFKVGLMVLFPLLEYSESISLIKSCANYENLVGTNYF